ncbi:hypothetical protein DW818_15510, partial [Lacticaseibacillus paracasei]
SVGFPQFYQIQQILDRFSEAFHHTNKKTKNSQIINLTYRIKPRLEYYLGVFLVSWYFLAERLHYCDYSCKLISVKRLQM